MGTELRLQDERSVKRGEPQAPGVTEDSETSEARGAPLKGTLSQLLEQLDASSGGLTQEEAGGRLERYGYNELAEKKVNPILKFLSYFWGRYRG